MLSFVEPTNNSAGKLNSNQQAKNEMQSPISSPSMTPNNSSNFEVVKPSFTRCKGSLSVHWTFFPKEVNSKVESVRFSEDVLRKCIRVKPQPGVYNNPNSNIDLTKVVFTDISIENVINTSPYSVNVTVAQMNDLVNRVDNNGHVSLFAIHDTGRSSEVKRVLYHNECIEADENISKLAVLTETTLEHDWTAVPGKKGENDVALVSLGSDLHKIMMKNSKLLDLDTNSNLQLGKFVTSPQIVQAIISNIEKHRKSRYNFTDVSELEFSFYRTDSNKFDDLRGSKYDTHNKYNAISDGLEDQCTIAFDIDFEVMAPVSTQIHIEKRNSESPLKSIVPKSPMGLGSGYQNAN